MTDKSQPDQAERTRLIARYLIREDLGLLVLGIALFWPAGRLDWLMGWVLIGITFLWVGATAFILIVKHPGLLAERMGPKKGSKKWDTAIMRLIGVLTLTRCVVAGLDVRFGWTTTLFPAHQIGAIIFAILGYAIVVWATSANAFFSQIVRIQEERDHTVATRGPYQFVRHPAYMGTLLFELAVPIMLGSWWALLPGSVIGLLFTLRTALEDRTLQDELDGYKAYAQKVSYRLIPGVW